MPKYVPVLLSTLSEDTKAQVPADRFEEVEPKSIMFSCQLRQKGDAPGSLVENLYDNKFAIFIRIPELERSDVLEYCLNINRPLSIFKPNARFDELDKKGKDFHLFVEALEEIGVDYNRPRISHESLESPGLAISDMIAFPNIFIQGHSKDQIFDEIKKIANTQFSSMGESLYRALYDEEQSIFACDTQGRYHTPPQTPASYEIRGLPMIPVTNRPAG